MAISCTSASICRYWRIGFVLLFCLGVASARGQGQYVRIQRPDSMRLEDIARLVSVERADSAGIQAWGDTASLEKLRRMGIAYNVLPQFKSAAELTMALTIEQMADWNRYPSFQVYVALLERMENNYPDLCRLLNLGKSRQGRDILCLKISKNPDIAQDEPRVLYVGQIHGDELLTYILLLRLADYLLSEYAINEQVQTIVDNMEVWICPLLNPDGTYWGGDETVAASVRTNAASVDLNRNFPDPEEGEHPDAKTWQPETKVVMKLSGASVFCLSSTLHSGAEVVNYPWDTWPRLHADDIWLKTAAHAFADQAIADGPEYYFQTITSNGIINGYSWYPTYGSMQDYMTYFAQSRNFTTEVIDTKKPDALLLPDYWDYTRNAFIDFTFQALTGIRGIVSDPQGNPLPATITIVGHDKDNSQVRTDTAAGYYHRLIAPGEWDVLAESFGYVSQTISDVSVESGTASRLNIVLQPDPNVKTVSGTVVSAQTLGPLEGSRVRLNDSPLNDAFANASGYFELSGIPDGNYSLVVSAPRHVGKVLDFQVPQTLNLSIALDTFAVLDLEDDLAGSAFDSAGDLPWGVYTNDSKSGNYSLRSGAITHNQRSDAVLFVEADTNLALSFYYKVSSEYGFDYLSFYLNGFDDDRFRWSGNSGDWKQAVVRLEEGLNVCRWSYAKDPFQSAGSDMALIDDIALIAWSNVTVLPDNWFSACWFSGGFVYVDWSGPPNELVGFSVVDATGRVVASDEAVMFPGVNSIDFQKYGLSSGLYVVRLRAADAEHALRIMR